MHPDQWEHERREMVEEHESHPQRQFLDSIAAFCQWLEDNPCLEDDELTRWVIKLELFERHDSARWNRLARWLGGHETISDPEGYLTKQKSFIKGTKGLVVDINW